MRQDLHKLKYLLRKEILGDTKKNIDLRIKEMNDRVYEINKVEEELKKKEKELFPHGVLKEESERYEEKGRQGHRERDRLRDRERDRERERDKDKRERSKGKDNYRRLLQFDKPFKTVTKFYGGKHDDSYSSDANDFDRDRDRDRERDTDDNYNHNNYNVFKNPF